THCQTSGVSLTAKDPYNNVVRTTLEALAAVLGGTQSLHTNALDEALALPTPFSARIARNTQLILAEESGVTKVVDPLGGSYYVENLTQALIEGARTLIRDVEKRGGMTRAVMDGFPQRQIEEAAARKQARIDRGEETVVGVNRYPPDTEEKIKTLEVDNAKVREAQGARLKKIRAGRDDRACRAALDALTQAARGGKGNLLELAVVATRARATVGEVTQALEKVWPRHEARPKVIAGVYGQATAGDALFEKARAAVAALAKAGRRPRLLVAKLGQDGHDRGAKVIATAFADLGFEVDIGPLFATPEEAARAAIENDVDVVGVSSHAAGHKTLIPALIRELQRHGARDIVVVVGGVVPPDDVDFLKNAGAAAVYPPGTHIPSAALEVLDLVRRTRKAAR
ncbi:MAG: methylmalonyl-CoA mutase, partial [Alphaproteobacteria bacterium]|nr:methylmalonyl-CoA mutase [Alphaproteobacteria bacterium]